MERLFTEEDIRIVENIMKGTFRVMQGDITCLDVDVIVNAANSRLAAGGGVCGAIHDAAGPELEDECDRIYEKEGYCPTGDCRMTDAYRLPCMKVIHAVGPIWHGGKEHEAELLASCYTKAIEMAYNAGYSSIAFPFISSGIYGYPKHECAEVAVKAIMSALKNRPMEVFMYCFSVADANLFNQIRDELNWEN